MKNTVVMMTAVIVLFFAIGCKKCYHCYNECVLCTYIDSIQTIARTLCRDSFNVQSQFDAAISADTASGYICNSTSPTYTDDFCVNKPGEDTYSDYFNKGNKIKCDEK